MAGPRHGRRCVAGVRDWRGRPNVGLPARGEPAEPKRRFHEAPHLGKERGLAGNSFESAVGKTRRAAWANGSRPVASDEVEPGPRAVCSSGRSSARKDEHLASDSCTRLRTSVVLPIPAAPPIRVRRPRPALAAARSSRLESLPSSSDEGRPTRKLARPGIHLVLHLALHGTSFRVPRGSACCHTVWKGVPRYRIRLTPCRTHR